MSSSGTLAEFLIKLGFKVDESSEKSVVASANSLKSTLTKALGAIGVTLSIAGIANFTSDSIEAASTAEQMQQKFDAVFTGIEDSADEWAGNLANSIGRSKNDIKTYMADIQNLLVGMGMEREAGAELTEQMVEAAINIASFNNIEDETAVNAMSKALMGETESAKTLGAVLNDNTIATAMNTLGITESFDALDEATKMQVRYQAIVNQSADALRTEDGVVGDAALSMDSYESKLRSFSAVLEDVKINVGTYLLPYATKLLSAVSNIMQEIRDFTEELTDANNAAFSLDGIVEGLTSALSALWTTIRNVASFIGSIVNRLGGLNNAIKLVGMTLAALAAYKAFSSMSTSVSGLISLVGKLNLKLLAIVAVIVAILLVIDDIRAFMNGEDSLIGSMIESNGGDADTLRDTLTSAFDNIKEAIDNIKQAFEDMAPSLEQAWSVISPILSTIAEISFAAVIATVTGLASALGPLINLFTDLVTLVTDFFSGDWDSLAEDFENIWDDLVDTVTGFVDGIFTTLNEMLGINLPTDMKTWATDMVDNFISGITGFLDKVKEVVSPVTDWIAGVLGHSTPKEGPLAGDDEWGTDFMQNFTTGIEGEESALQTVVNGAADILAGIGSGFVSGVNGIIGGITGNSIDVSEESESAVTVTSDSSASILQSIQETIETGLDLTLAQIDSAVTKLSKLTTTGNALLSAMSGTVTPPVEDITNTYYNVTQNISYSNTFNGDTTSNQTKAASKMKEAATDTTTYLANALAFGR